jgi:hypothetical protein
MVNAPKPNKPIVAGSGVGIWLMEKLNVPDGTCMSNPNVTESLTGTINGEKKSMLFPFSTIVENLSEVAEPGT